MDSLNLRRRVRLVELARRVCDGSIVSRRIAVLGTAFKPGSALLGPLRSKAG